MRRRRRRKEVKEDNNNNNFVSSAYEQPEVNHFPKNLGAASKFWCQKCDMKQSPY
jgi:hypothetical protein